jgi:hypothetical protein
MQENSSDSRKERAKVAIYENTCKTNTQHIINFATRDETHSNMLHNDIRTMPKGTMIFRKSKTLQLSLVFTMKP